MERGIGKIPKELGNILIKKGFAPVTIAAMLFLTGCHGNDNKIDTATPTPSAATGTPRPTDTPTIVVPTKTPEATMIPTTEINQKPISDAELADLRFQSTDVMQIRIIQNPEEAAKRFGDDSYSVDPSHWRITQFGAELIPNPDGTITRLKSDNTLLDGYIDGIRLVYAPTVEERFVKSAVIWNFPNDVKRTVEQPGVSTFWVCPDSAKPQEFIPLAEKLTKDKAAKTYGDDPYSSNPSHWTINEFGGATLQPNPNGKNSKLRNLTDGAIVEGWWGVDQNGENSTFDAIAFVTSPDMGNVILRGGTFWKFRKEQASSGAMQLFFQLKAVEKNEQPGVPILLLCNYLPLSVCIPPKQ